MPAGKSMLVIGASGFIGAHVRDAARAEGYEVTGASRRDPQLALDLTDRTAVGELIGTLAPDVIVNAAGPPSVAQSWAEPAEVAQAHAIGTLNVLDAVQRSAPATHLIAVSSGEVYGSSDSEFAETAAWQPLTPYGAAKAAMEIFCDQFARSRELAVTIVRPFNQIGPGLSMGHAIADFVAEVAAAEEAGRPRVELAIGNPGSVRDYTDIRDSAADIVELAVRRALGTYNLCSGQGVSILQLVAALDRTTEVEVSARPDPALARPSDPARKVGRPDRLRGAIGRRPRIGLDETLADMLSEARAAPIPRY